MIHQELNLMDHLTVAQNIFIGREPAAGSSSTKAALNAQAPQLFDGCICASIPERGSAPTVAQQQMVEIAKALCFNSSVLIMDEPTAALTDTEIDELFRIIRDLRDEGVGVVHISHRLEELKQISDRITVMRDGRYIATVKTAEAKIEQIISMMVGRTIFEATPEVPEQRDPEVVLEVRDSIAVAIRDVSFQLHRGEILGIAGLVGAGRTEVARAVFGADRPTRARSSSTASRSRSGPDDAVRHGIGYLSEDRKRYGLALGLNVETNIVMASLQRFASRFGWVDRGATRAAPERRCRTWPSRPRGSASG